ncbi:hypothetical protein LZ575_15440 [Antarcticibacterium sp. 1MA-6-2]|uniref:DUF6616 family protein n=1 Tax=Antarcticibacterium sp. 1MA-6-2 TaxID=2908210 RepID=UPI001F32C8AA|nr:DUF6616 family protein [Antarcticibacterium sp. 1MA-6-2]UJH90254.1 hypothetical protein LZ575_15440 [Antarcticibacterium sp. 1MA-6-2]
MYIYVELWNVIQKCMDLSKQEREDFFNKVGPEIQKLMDKGVEVTGWAMNDEHTPYRSDYRYMAVWKIPSLELVETLERAVADAGWHNYFSQVNARGQIIPLDQAIDNLINLEKHSTSIIE